MLGEVPVPTMLTTATPPTPSDPSQQHFKRNQQYAVPAKSYVTQLDPKLEQQFQSWVKEKQVPWQDSPTADYDMRGFFQALQSKDPLATTAVNPNDNKIHYPDKWKTPYHKSFSRESKYATPKAPKWNDKDQLVMDDGTVIYDERAEAQKQK
jgi:2-hydroxy-3-keto-5-methylthiopentenyl-1-phosphate phosphatase